MTAGTIGAFIAPYIMDLAKTAAKTGLDYYLKMREKKQMNKKNEQQEKHKHSNNNQSVIRSTKRLKFRNVNLP